MEYHLIVELDPIDSTDRPQLVMISDEIIYNIQRPLDINNCYTGKRVIIDLNGTMRSACVCMVADDPEFLRAQLAHIQEERVVAMETDQGRDILQPSLAPLGSSRQISPDSATNHSQQQQPELPQPQVPLQLQPQLPQPRLANPNPPMTFDQQTQTDHRLYGGLVPATAAQLHQNMVEMAQIRNQNNAILNTLNEVLNNQVVFMSRMDRMQAGQDDLLGRVRSTEVHVTQLHQLVSAPPPENPVLVQLTPDESASLSSVSLHVDTSDPPSEESVEQKPIIKAYRASRANKSKSPDNDENRNPNAIKKVRVGEDFNKTGESSQAGYNFERTEDVIIGTNGTRVPANVLQGINWACFSVATRRILVAVFSRKILATHSLSGKPSPAFLDRNAKKQLDPLKIQDIVQFVAKNSNVSESNVRSIITAKCADENKMLKSSTSDSSFSETNDDHKDAGGAGGR
ncbi:hypothetical protein DMENIID0001_126780 [Sergentomyia squamirostris]